MEETEIGEVSVDKSAEAAHEKAREERHRVPWLKWLALSTTCFAVVAAVASLKSGRDANEALLHQSRSSDQWSFYQAKGNKAVTRKAEMEVLTELHAAPERMAAIAGEIEKYGREQEAIRHEAEELQDESRRDLMRHEWFAGLVTLLQIAIGLSAIGALLESKAVWLASLVAGGVATVVFIIRLAVG
jgi:hypothetical protein